MPLSLVVVLATRYHYSLDVVLAFLVTKFSFDFYHKACNIEQLRKQIWILQWLEAEEILAHEDKAYGPFPIEIESE